MALAADMPGLGAQRIGAAATVRDTGLFEDAPPRWLQRRLGLVAPGLPRIGRRALLVVLIGWVPLALLAVAQSLFRPDVLSSFALETGVHARYLLAAPLLVLAEAECAARLGRIVHHFVESGLVRDEDCGRFDAAVASTRRLLGSPAVEIAVVVLAYGVVGLAMRSRASDLLPAWHASSGGPSGFSPAGWWHVLVSLPLLLALFLGWVWRLALWTHLLWRVSRLDLRLVASHPDHAAGLAFVGQSVRAFSVVALAVAVVAAGRSAHAVLTGGGLPTPHLFFNIGLFVTMLVLFTAPLAVFTPVLMNAWRSATLFYGALAGHVGDAFERKWLDRGGQAEPAVLEKPDFSATTDLYQVVSNVYGMRFVPVDLKDLIVLAATMLLPFVPVVFLAVPLDTIWTGIKDLLF